MADDQDLLSKAQVTTGFWWLAVNYGARIRMALAATQSWALQDSIPETLVIAIALKETGPLFINNPGKIAPSELLGLLIGDATGDYPGTETKRTAFPKNAAAFREKYDTATDTSFSDMLVEEANKSRKRLKGWPERTWIYKGYGLFQYDLQNVVADEKFSVTSCGTVSTNAWHGCSSFLPKSTNLRAATCARRPSDTTARAQKRSCMRQRSSSTRSGAIRSGSTSSNTSAG